ncbi:hypothetical protein HDU76_008142, partial [Blyttiomyces sp. JEL0837]
MSTTKPPGGASKKYFFRIVLTSVISTAITILSLQAILKSNSQTNNRSQTIMNTPQVILDALSTLAQENLEYKLYGNQLLHNKPYGPHNDHKIDQQKQPPSNSSNQTWKHLKGHQYLNFIHKIESRERRIYSQYNEDGIIEYIFDNISPVSKYYVEFGTENCSECTTRYLYEIYGWDGLLIDGNGTTGDKRVIRNHFITRENIVGLFEKYGVAKEFGMLTVDVDYNEFWIAKTVLDAGYRPNLLIMEINRNFGPRDSFTVPYKSTAFWSQGPYFGQSALAAARLAKAHDYIPIYTDTASVNMFFLHIYWVQQYLLAKTGILFELDEIRLFVPTFEEIYRRQKGIHAPGDMLKRFWRWFKREDWVVVGEDGEYSIVMMRVFPPRAWTKCCTQFNLSSIMKVYNIFKYASEGCSDDTTTFLFIVKFPKLRGR